MDGRTWAAAFDSVPAAIEVAASLPPSCDVWIAAGEYRVYRDAPQDTIALASSVAILGGFAGTESGREERDPAVNVVVLSGTREDHPNSAVIHVLTADSVTGVALDGLEITGGRAIGSGNTREDVGGGLLALDSVITISRCSFYGNTAINEGGAVYLERSNGTLTEVELTQNVADRGAALFGRRSSVVVRQSSVAGNSTSSQGFGSGAGVHLTEEPFDGQTEIRNSSFLNNHATGPGGAVVVGATSTIISDSSFAGNTGLHGGAIVADSFSGTISNCAFSSNESAESGGAIRVIGGTATIIDSSFTQNRARNGGGLDLSRANLVIAGLVLQDNQADEVGGGIRLSESNATIERCWFQDNTAAWGGAAALVTESSPTVKSCLVVRNHASLGGGAFFNDYLSSPDIINCTIFDNATGGPSGGALYSQVSSYPVVINSILWANFPDSHFEELSSTFFAYCDVQDLLEPGSGNLSVDPGFVDPDALDLHLGAGSPCIDSARGDEAPGTDYDGFARIDDPATPNSGSGVPPYADIGAFEHQE
jgi:predicted outer membrane repeat protein